MQVKEEKHNKSSTGQCDTFTAAVPYTKHPKLTKYYRKNVNVSSMENISSDLFQFSFERMFRKGANRESFSYICFDWCMVWCAAVRCIKLRIKINEPELYSIYHKFRRRSAPEDCRYAKVVGSRAVKPTDSSIKRNSKIQTL